MYTMLNIHTGVYLKGLHLKETVCRGLGLGLVLGY